MSLKSIKKQLILPLGIALLFIVLVAVGCIYWLQLRHIEQAVNTRLAGVERLIPELLNKKAEGLKVQLDFLSRDKELQLAWLNRDRERLNQYISPLFEHFRAEHGFSHFYLIQPDRSCFLRAHRPDIHGDLIDRFTLAEATRTGEIATGVELGRFEALSLRVVKPWYIDGELSGYLELSKEVMHITSDLQKILGGDLVFTLSKSRLNRKAWEQGKNIFATSGNWDDFPSFVVVDQTFGRLPSELLGIFKYSKLADDQHLSIITEENRNYRGRIAPLHDAGGDRIGQILVFHDITAEVGYLKKAAGLVAVFSIATGALLFFLFNLHADKIDRKLRRSFAALEHEIGERKQTETELENYQAQLYELVEERTTELKETNALLQRDILRRQRVEEALRESEQKFRSLFECANENIFIIDPETLSLLEANKTAGQRLGYSSEELKSFSLADLYSPAEAERARKDVDRIINAGQLVFERVQLTRDGLEVPVEVSNQVIEFEGKKAVLSFAREITDRKKAEAELQRTQKLESIGILAGGIAHDFNNILTAIQGNITLAMIYTTPESKALAKLLMAEKASLRAKALAQQLLTFAKGGAPLKNVFPVEHLVREPVTLALRGSNIKSEYEFPADLRLVKVDEGQFSQVVSNLAINAMQAMPGGGVLSIGAANEFLGPDNSLGLTAGQYVRMEFNDQGVGISKPYLDKIFDPYFTTKETGSGLGLAISYSVIKKHNGIITVNSRPGLGSTFLLYLPASEEKFPRLCEEDEEVHRGTGRILVMDDDETVTEIAAELLHYLGYQAETVDDGSRAVAAYRRAREANEPFDAVITDLTVPGGMSGTETLRQLLAIDPEAKVIVSSGYANDSIMADYATHGFKGVLPKPYKTAELSKTLREVLG